MDTLNETREYVPTLADGTVVDNIAQFKQWTRERVRPLLPHEILACGYGHLHAGGVALDYVVTVDYPMAHLQAIRNKAGGIDTPILRRWLSTGEPQLFEADDPWPDVPPEWLQHFRRHGLQNSVAHAMYDTALCVGTYFSFHRVEGKLGAHHVERVRQIVPVMHEALCRVIAHENEAQHFAGALAALTEREHDIVRWLGLGKSNADIVAIAGLSETTVKHHFTRIFVKVGVDNRAQLIRRLAEHELRAAPGFGTKVF